ncbi:MAG: hypothetical protein JSU66_17585 [Deltaproteobacteria bacterium]|nr:MAG: hypothetical protein JSU66_17585 [Deltaproteobacteria bacterium]
MSPERATEVLSGIAERAPGMFAQAVHAASTAMKARPVYLNRQPFERRANAVRRAVARVSANPLAEELLAVYFLECRRPLLVEWLDTLGVEHEDGLLASSAPPAPPSEQLHAALTSFRKAEDAADRELLLRAFAAQSAIDWPELDAALEAPRAG